MPTDCPQRDERLGWTGDAQVFVRTAAFNRDVAGFFTKWPRIWKTPSRPRALPQGRARPRRGGDGGPAWADAGVICPWTITSVTATRLLAERYESMRCSSASWPRLAATGGAATRTTRAGTATATGWRWTAPVTDLASRRKSCSARPSSPTARGCSRGSHRCWQAHGRRAIRGAVSGCAASFPGALRHTGGADRRRDPDILRAGAALRPAAGSCARPQPSWCAISSGAAITSAPASSARRT